MSGWATNHLTLDLGSRSQFPTRQHLARRNPLKCATPDREMVIRETADWLARAYQEASGNGLAGFYHLDTGWSAACRETTVTAIPAFLVLADRFPQSDWLARARSLGKLLQKQHVSENKTIINLTPDQETIYLPPAILGWTGLSKHTADPRCKRAAVAAGLRLAGNAENIGDWLTSSPGEVPHIVRALAVLADLWPDEELERSLEVYGLALLKTITEPRDGKTGPAGLAETLIQDARMLTSLLEAGIVRREKRWVTAARQGADKLLAQYRSHTALPARTNAAGQADYSVNCMAGCAQVAKLWLRFFEHGAPDEYLRLAVRLNKFVASTVDATNPDPGIRGGIRAGYPLWVDYYPLAYRTLAARIALDAFLLEEQIVGTGRPSRKLALKKSMLMEDS